MCAYLYAMILKPFFTQRPTIPFTGMPLHTLLLVLAHPFPPLNAIAGSHHIVYHRHHRNEIFVLRTYFILCSSIENTVVCLFEVICDLR